MTDETKLLIEERLAERLEELNDLEVGSKERKSVLEELDILTEKLVKIEQMETERKDREDRRQIEREKNEASINLEYEKNDIGWKRMVLEVGKIVVPVMVPIIAYDVFQQRLLKFEETGRVSSTAGRELHLPRFFK